MNKNFYEAWDQVTLSQEADERIRALLEPEGQQAKMKGKPGKRVRQKSVKFLMAASAAVLLLAVSAVAGSWLDFLDWFGSGTKLTDEEKAVIAEFSEESGLSVPSEGATLVMDSVYNDGSMVKVIFHFEGDVFGDAAWPEGEYSLDGMASLVSEDEIIYPGAAQTIEYYGFDGASGGPNFVYTCIGHGYDLRSGAYVLRFSLEELTHWGENAGTTLPGRWDFELPLTGDGTETLQTEEAVTVLVRSKEPEDAQMHEVALEDIQVLTGSVRFSAAVPGGLYQFEPVAFRKDGTEVQAVLVTWEETYEETGKTAFECFWEHPIDLGELESIEQGGVEIPIPKE